MDRLIEVAYYKFLLRDVLSYVVPGAMLVGVVALAVGRVADLAKFGRESKWAGIVVGVGFSYVLGLFIAAGAASAHLARQYPTPDAHALRRGSAYCQYVRQLAVTPAARWEDASWSWRERLIILKQAHANVGACGILAGAVAFVALLVRGRRAFIQVDPPRATRRGLRDFVRVSEMRIWLPLTLCCASLAVVMLLEHAKLVSRQLTWDQSVLDYYECVRSGPNTDFVRCGAHCTNWRRPPPDASQPQPSSVERTR